MLLLQVRGGRPRVMSTFPNVGVWSLLLLGFMAGVFLLGWPSQGHTTDIDFGGELSSWITGTEGAWSESEIGALYIPELKITLPLPENRSLDGMAALRLSTFAPVNNLDTLDNQADLDLYRLWARFTTGQSELRIGLQRISFGPAFLIRPLMWFDRIDPRDPLQLTAGVYALTGRYHFLNGVSVWGWGLAGNDEPKGWEILPSTKDDLEYGGRVQAPLLEGQMGLSANRRTVDASNLPGPQTNANVSEYPETRFALDGRWDIGVGLWFEGVLIHSDDLQIADRNQRNLTLGGDYTFAWGNGLHVLAEHFIGDSLSETAYDDTTSITAATLDYPLGLADHIAGFVYYTWDDGNWSRLVRWGHQFEKWTLHVIGFWNDTNNTTGLTSGGNERYSGTGFQLLAVWKH